MGHWLKKIKRSLISGLGLCLLLATPAWAEPQPLIIDEPTPPATLQEIDRFYKIVRLRWQDLQGLNLTDETALKDGFETVNNLLFEAKKREGQEQKVKIRQAYQHLLELQIRMMPSRVVEFRGALLHANLLDTTPENIREMVRKFKNAGFNALIPEVFRRGNALFPNRVAQLDPQFAYKKIDVLKALVEEARAQNMQVYPWFWVFRLLSPTVNTYNPILERLPALRFHELNHSNHEKPQSVEDESKAFISPAAFEWRELLTSMMMDMLAAYPVNGILLDYIRYGDHLTEDQLSYTRFQLDYFQKVGSFPPVRIERDSPIYNQWHLWREEQVNWMVKQLRQQSQTRQGVSLGAAVFRNQVHTRNTKMQNWRHWADNHWLDFVSPMLYGEELGDLDLWLDWISDNNQRQDMLYPILGAHKTRERTTMLFNQLALFQKRQIPGFSVFSVGNLNAVHLNLLKIGPFRNQALVPHSNIPQALDHHLKMTQDLTESLLKSNPPYATSLESFKAPLNRARKALAGANNTNGVLGGKEAEGQMQALVDVMKNIQAKLPEALGQDLSRRAGYALELAKIYRQKVQPYTYIPPSPPPTQILESAKALPQVVVPEMSNAPLIDGLLDDSAWQNSQPLSPFYWSHGSRRPDVKTEVRLGFDQQHLYIGFKAEEPRMDRLQARPPRLGSKTLNQTDDTLEVFLSPSKAPHQYYYFVVNPSNARLQESSRKTGGVINWRSATGKIREHWMAELAIPFNSLHVKSPEELSHWRGNFCRRRPQEIDPYHCWSFTYGGVHRPERFGHLKFKPLPKPSPVAITAPKNP